MVTSNLTNFREVPPDVNLEIAVRYYKKIEGIKY